MGQRAGRRVAHQFKEGATIELGEGDAAVVVRPNDRVSVYIPDLETTETYPENVFSVLAFLVALDDEEMRAMMQARLERHLIDAAGGID